MPATTSYPLFALQTTNGNSSAIAWRGGRGVFYAYGTPNGATVKLQWSPDAGTTWLDVDRSGDTFVTFTANGAGGFELPECQIRANLASAGGSTSMNAAVASSDM